MPTRIIRGETLGAAGWSVLAFEIAAQAISHGVACSGAGGGGRTENQNR